MKRPEVLPLLLALGATIAAGSPEVLTTDAAVFQQADASSPVITRLAQGASVAFVGAAPAGWRRVEVDGTFEAFVHTRDITKGLDVRTGANLLTAPAATAAVLTAAQPEDRTEIVGLRGDYCQVRVTKRLQGFIATTEIANRPARPAVPATLPGAPAAAVPAPGAGRPVAATNSASLPRLFSGTLVVARRAILNPNPPYDYQLSDLDGRRFAYVDTKRLVLADRLEDLIGRPVLVTGTVRNTVDGRDLVVAAEAIEPR